MNLIEFGNTGLYVSKLCIGTGTAGFAGQSRQSKIHEKTYAEILKTAFHNGINFWDTSDDYGTHSHVRVALKEVPRNKVVISTKIHAQTSIKAGNDFNNCLEELDVKYIDILILHEIDTISSLEASNEALSELGLAKKRGGIRAVGASTHSINILEKIAVHPKIDVVFANFNFAELHMDASLKDYSNALKTAFNSGKGVFVMKTLAEGKLKDKYKEAIEFNLKKDFIHSVCVGITSLEELNELINFAKTIL